MAKLGIFTGTSANDTTGDTLSQGAVKINRNFSEIYTAFGDGTNITNSLSTITVAGLSTFTSGPVLIGSGIQTGTSKLQVSGDTSITGSVGVGTTNPASKLHIIGDGRFTGVVTALSFSGNASSAGYAVTAGIATYSTNAGTSTSVIGGIGSITQLRVTGISTFTNGPVLIGGGTSTGTAGQVFQVSGISSGAYIGGSVGIGTTNPTESLHVVGNVKVTGTITGEVSSTVATAKTSTSVIGGIASVTQLQVGPGITTVGFITATGAYIGVATVGFITATNAYVGVATVGFITATNAYVGVATVGFLTATNAYVGVATVGFLTASNIWVSGVTTSGGIVVTTNNVYKVGIDTVLNSTTLGSGVTYSSLITVGTLNQLKVSSTGITTVGFITATSAYVSGVITATTFSSGIATQTVGFTTSTISGPSLMFISPYSIGINTGTVRIIGNLIVEGSTTTQTQATIQSSASIIGIAISETSNAALEGAGIGIGSITIQKLFTYHFAGGGSLKSSENLNVGAGKSYQIDDVPVLSSTTLGTGVTISSLTSVGSLKQLVVSSDTSTDAVRITQTGSGNALIVEDSANPDSNLFVVNTDGSVGIGTTNPTSKLTVLGDVLVSGASTFVGDGTAVNPAIFARRTITQDQGIKLYGTSNGNFVYSESTGSNPKPLIVDSTQQENIVFRIAGATKAVIQPSGEVGIGTSTFTGTASQLLQVTGGAYVSGNLGVGNTNPQNTLDVGVGTIRLINKSSTGRFSQIYQDNELIFSNSSTNDDFSWTNGSGSRMRLYGAGNLVIPGTFTPTGTASQRLQVDGGAYVSVNLGVGVTNPATNTQVAIAGTLGIDAVGNAGTRTLFTSSTSGFTLNHNDNSQITFQTLGTNRLTYSHSSNFWTIPAGIPFLVGTASSTGTANQLLRVEGGAYVSGSVGIGTTNPGATLNVVPTATSIAGLFSGTTSSDMVRITQLGTGNALVVEDSTNPDSSPFVVTGIGSVGIGTASPAFTADIAGDARVTSTNKMRFGGTAGTTNFYIQYNSTANSLDFVAG